MKIIKKIIFTFLLFIPSIVFAKDINIYLFYGETCPHCAKEEEFLDSYLEEDNEVHLYKYEVWYNTDNQDKLKDIQEILDTTSNGVPYLVIGNNAVVGFIEGTTEEEIKNTINYYKNTEYTDKVGIYLGLVKEEDTTTDSKYTNEEINVPLLGKVNVKETSILLVSIIIGLVDGFNPCAMWILIFLISMLITMKDKKRMWTIGIVFLVSSALIYFLFMISWLNLAVILNKIIYVRLFISVIAIVFGMISIVNYFKSLNSDTGCEVVNQNRRKKIISRITNIVKQKSFILAILGTVILAVSVNTIELMCSLGLPVMFSQILTLNNISNNLKIVYSIIYVIFFMLDDILIFIIAMKTLEIKAISNKYAKYSHLIGGIIMVLIGVLIIVKPEWLTFNF